MKNKVLLIAIAVLMMAACTNNQTKENNDNEEQVNAEDQTALQEQDVDLDTLDLEAIKHEVVLDTLALEAFNQELEATLKAGQTNSADEEMIIKEYCSDYIWEHPTEGVAHYVLFRYKWAFTPVEMHNMIDNIYQADNTITSNYLTMAEEYVEKLDRVQPGQPMIDFTQNDPEGNPVTLSQLAEGKLLLVDFWASWCPDCRKANPDVVAAYQRYHDQGFDVLGVSFDENKDKWLDAIEKDGLTWTHVSDLQRWDNAAGKLYSIAFIPQNALIKDGIIVARNLEGEDLMKEIEVQLKK